MDPPYWSVNESVGGTADDEDFDNLMKIFDMPLESLEDGGEWDASKSQFLGPIPSDALSPLPPICSTDQNCLFNFPKPIKKEFDRTPLLKSLPTALDQACKVTSSRKKLSGAQEACVFQSQSPVSVLESSGSCLAGKGMTLKRSAIPKKPRSRHLRSSFRNPWLMILLGPSTPKSTVDAKKKEKKKKSLSRIPTVPETLQNSGHEFRKKLAYGIEKKETSFHQAVNAKKCTHCEVTKTPQWREGPLGPKTLCNACGVRYRSGRLFPEYRPAASPTFIPSLHSNSHKKVVEMRKKASQQATVAEELPMSPPPEFVPIKSDFIFDSFF